MDITDELIAEFASQGNSAAQKNAITVAFEKYRERAAKEAKAKPKGKVLPPQTKNVLIVLSGRLSRASGPTDSELQQVREDLAVMQDRSVRETGEGLHIITAGRMGAEREAETWAKKHGVPIHQIAACFALPSPSNDGTTVRRLDARNTRNQRLTVFIQNAIEQGAKVGVRLYGVELPRDSVAPVAQKAIKAVTDRIASRQPQLPVETSVEQPEAEAAVKIDVEGTPDESPTPSTDKEPTETAA